MCCVAIISPSSADSLRLCNCLHRVILLGGSQWRVAPKECKGPLR